MQKILEPIKVKNVTFQNRVVRAPMVNFGAPQNEDGTMSAELLQHYIRRASTGMGLMICQSLSVSPKAVVDGGVGVYSELHIGYLRTLTEECHKSGVKFFAQLAYHGAAFQNGGTINNLSVSDLKEIKNDFVRAIKICKDAGCDGIELHGAHGFFLNMMASALSNKLENEYGEDVNGRLRLVREIVADAKKFTTDDFIISYRMGWNDSLAMDVEMAKALEALGIEMLHISYGIPFDRKLNIPAHFDFNNTVYTGRQIKKEVNIPVIVVNDIRTLRRGDYLIENDLCDFAAYGRPFLADAAFMEKSLLDYDCKSCLNCKECKWFVNGEKCPADDI